MRITAVIFAGALLAALPAHAQPGHDMHDMGGMSTPTGPASPPAQPTPEPSQPAENDSPVSSEVGNAPPPAPPADYAADRVYPPSEMQAARAALHREHGGEPQWMTMVSLAEYQAREGLDGYRWEASFWYGGDINRFVVTTEGEASTNQVEAAEVQLLYSRAISPFFNLRGGLRYDFEPRPSRTYATVSVSGVAPYWFDVDAALFLSSEGELSARLEGAYDFRLTQRLILQPRAEMNLSATSVPEREIGSGVTNLELGLRLRYEFRREFALYVGISHDQTFGETADFRRAAGHDAAETAVVFGARTWF